MVSIRIINTACIIAIVSISCALLFFPLPYCEGEQTAECRPCPIGGTCHGLTVSCPDGFYSNGTHCVKSSSIMSKQESMRKQIADLLRKRMGDYLCENYTSTHAALPFVSRSEMEDFLHFDMSNREVVNSTDYGLFMEILASYPCYRLRNGTHSIESERAHSIESERAHSIESERAHSIESDHTHIIENNHAHIIENNHAHIIENNHAHTINDNHAHTIQSERTHCTDRIRPTVVSPYQDEYFVERENPTIGTYCAFRRTLDAHSAIIHSYLSRLAQSVAIVLGVLLVYTLITESIDMKTEVENILIENMQQSDKYVSVAAIRSSLIKYGNYGLITRLLWKPVAHWITSGNQVAVMDRLVHDQCERFWCWIGEAKDIRKTSRRPTIQNSIEI
ncbi:hypothetical protein WA588_006275, partial [Blastocystis sp. NMH]